MKALLRTGFLIALALAGAIAVWTVGRRGVDTDLFSMVGTDSGRGAVLADLDALSADAVRVLCADAARAAEERRTAIDYYDKALAVRPRLITALYARAKLHHEDGADEQARELLDRTEGMPIGMLCPVTRAQIEQLRREAGGAS